MFLDSIEPTKILHYAYVNVKDFPIDFPTEIVVLCHYRKPNNVPWIINSIKILIYISEITSVFCTDQVVVPLISGFSITSNEHH
jgi:hypothetical protein